MKLTILTPFQSREIDVEWMELNTSAGNFVIEKGHAPIILTLRAGMPFIIGFLEGKIEKILPTSSGVVFINRYETLALFEQAL